MPNTITWLGHSAYKVETSKGLKFFIDPFITGNPLCPGKWQDDNDCDLVVCTHGHGDHIGDAERILNNSDAHFAGIYEIAAWMGNKIGDDARTTGFSKGGTWKFKGVRFSMTHAIHGGGLNDGAGFAVGGAEAGYVIQFEDGKIIYDAGDTDVFMDMQLIGRVFGFKIDVALLPIGGFFTMDPKRAAIAAELIKPKKVFPMHYGTWPPLVGTPDEFRDEMDAIGLKDIEMIVVKPGESFEV